MYARYPQASLVLQALKQISLDDLQAEPPLPPEERPARQEPGIIDIDRSLDKTVLLPQDWGKGYRPANHLDQDDTEANL